MKVDLREESGAVTVVVAAVVASLLFIAVIALVVDSGVVYLERRTVTNAAQSASLAIARECVEEPTTCATSPIAQQFANSNSPDGLTEVTEVCIDGLTPSKSSCRPLSQSKIDCTSIPSTIKKYVRIRTQSLSGRPGVGVQTYFSGNRSETLQACAQARWGNAASAATYTPFAISICEWAKRQVPPINTASKTIPEFDEKNGISSCEYTFKDMNDGTFTRTGISGWASLDLMSGSIPAQARSDVACPNPQTDDPAQLRIGYELSPITRSQSSKNFCGDTDLASKMANWLGQTHYIPLISTRKLDGQATTHKVEAFASFKLLGYSFLKGEGSGSRSGGTVPNGDWCPKNTSCIYGDFLSTTSPASEISDDPTAPQIGLQALELF